MIGITRPLHGLFGFAGVLLPPKQGFEMLTPANTLETVDEHTEGFRAHAVYQIYFYRFISSPDFSFCGIFFCIVFYIDTCIYICIYICLYFKLATYLSIYLQIVNLPIYQSINKSSFLFFV